MKTAFKIHLDKNSSLIVDSLGQFYQQIIPVSIKNFDKKGLPFPCVYVCGKPLQRPHFTCLACRERKVYIGKLPSLIPIQSIILLNAKHKRFAFLKNLILKNLLRFIEVFLLG